MSLSWEARANAIQWYENAGMTVFPYDCEGYPFKDWPNPHMAATGHRRQVASQPGTAIFGAVLTPHTPVIDLDADHRGGSITDLEDTFGKLDPTMSVNTPGSDRNFHLYFDSEGVQLRTSKRLSKAFPGIDFLAFGSHVKGATSYRRLDTALDTQMDTRFYTMQHPILVPARLPPKLLEAWKETQVGSVEELLAIELAEAERGYRKPVLSTAEKRLLNKWLQEHVEGIRDAGDGERFSALSRHMLKVFQIGMLLTGSTRMYDRQIVQAYQDSGGKEPISYLRGLMEPTRVFAAQHPKAPPRVSAYVSTANSLIGDWADALLATVPKRNKVAAQVIKALAVEANANLKVTVSIELLMQRNNIPKTSESEVYKVLKQLIKQGWLVKTGKFLTLENKRWVSNYRLWQM